MKARVYLSHIKSHPLPFLIAAVSLIIIAPIVLIVATSHPVTPEELAEGVERDGVFYKKSENGGVTAYYQDDNCEKISIRATIANEAVTRIASKSSDEPGPNAGIAIKDINRTPRDMDSLKTIDGVLYESNNKDCTLLYYPMGKTDESYVIPCEVTAVGHCAFAGNEVLTSIAFPDDSKCKELGDSAFRSCTSLCTISLLSSLKTMGLRCFSDSSIQELYIPENVGDIRQNVFSNCTYLKSLTADGKYFKTVDNVLFSGSTLVAYPAGLQEESYTIPETVKNVRYGAFFGVSRLKALHVPSNETSFEQAFDEQCDITVYCGGKGSKAYNSLRKSKYCSLVSHNGEPIATENEQGANNATSPSGQINPADLIGIGDFVYRDYDHKGWSYNKLDSSSIAVNIDFAQVCQMSYYDSNYLKNNAIPFDQCKSAQDYENLLENIIKTYYPNSEINNSEYTIHKHNNSVSGLKHGECGFGEARWTTRGFYNGENSILYGKLLANTYKGETSLGIIIISVSPQNAENNSTSIKRLLSNTTMDHICFE